MPDNINALYPQQQPQNNLFSDPTKVLGLLGQVNALQKFQAEFGSRKAIGDAYSGALRPDGSIDTEKLASGMKSPAAAYGLPEAMTHVLAQRGQQLNLDTGGNSAIANEFAGIDPKTAKPDDIHDLSARMARKYPSIPISTINTMARTVLNDPEGLAHGIANMRNLTMGAAAVTAPAGDVINPETGTKETISTGEFGIRRAQSGGTQTTLPPGSDVSAKAHQDALIHAGNFGQEILPLNQALEAANHLKAKYGTGYFAPGSGFRQEFQSFLYGISPDLAKTLGVDPEKLKNFAEAKKYLTQAVASRVGGFGAGTVEQLKTAAGGNPSVDINDMAVDHVLKMLIAARRMEHVQTQLANQGSPDGKRVGGPVNFTQNSADWATKLDPRAFMLDSMEPKHILEIEKNLKGDDRRKFNLSLRAAVQSGLISQDKLTEINKQVLAEKEKATKK